MNEKERLEKLLAAENLTYTQFADKIGIQRSTLSHIMKGRNSPSLDVLQKTLNIFRSVSPDWLILGIGQMYRTSNVSQQTLFEPLKVPEVIVERQTSVYEPLDKTPKQPLIESKSIQNPKEITKIMVFYSDNTFDELNK